MKSANRSTFVAFVCAFGLSLASCGGNAQPPANSAEPTPAAESTTAPASTQAPTSTTAAQVVAAAPTGTSAPEPTVAPTPAAIAAPAGDPKSAILAALHKELTSGPYRTKTSISGSSTIEVVGEIIPPDKMHTVSTIAGKKNEMIFIVDKGWSKSGDTAWKALGSASDAGIINQINGSMIDEITSAISDAKLVGPDAVNGAPAFVYSYFLDSNKLKTPIDVQSNVKIWVSVANGLIMKQVIDGVAFGKKSTTVQIVEYDPAIAIDPPVK